MTLVRKEYYGQGTPVPGLKPFWECYKDYLKLLTCKASTMRKLKISSKVFEYFCMYYGYKADIETFDKTIYGRYIQYLIINQKMADSTINRHALALKAFLKFSYPQKDISFVKYTLMKIEGEIVALSEAELKILIVADLCGYLAKTRDLFAFLSTTGMRYSDSQLFDPSWITKEGVLKFNQLKTGGRAYPPLCDVSERILKRNKGILHRIH